MNCKNCGQEITEDTEFCENCLAELKNNASSKPPFSKKKKLLLTCFSIMIPVIIIFTSLFFIARNHEYNVKEPQTTDGVNQAAKAIEPSTQKNETESSALSEAASKNASAENATTAIGTQNNIPQTKKQPGKTFKTNFPSEEIAVKGKRTDIENPIDLCISAISKIDNAKVIEQNNFMNMRFDLPESLGLNLGTIVYKLYGIADQTDRNNPVFEMDLFVDFGFTSVEEKAYYKDGYLYYNDFMDIGKKKSKATLIDMNEMLEWGTVSFDSMFASSFSNIEAVYLEHELYKTRLDFTAQGEQLTKSATNILENLMQSISMPLDNTTFGETRVSVYLDANDDLKYINIKFDAEFSVWGFKTKAEYSASSEILSLDAVKINLPDDLDTYPEEQSPSNNIF